MMQVSEVHELDVEDYVLAVLWYARGRRVSKAQVMFVLAAFARLTGREEFFDYTPSMLGLYSTEVEAAINDLVYDGYIKRNGGYRLTDKGRKYASEAARKLEELHPDEADLLAKLTARYSNFKKDELLLLLHTLFCDDACRKASDEWEKLEKKRKEIALNMAREGKVSWRLAARLAGMTPEEFAEYAQRSGVLLGDELHSDNKR